MTFSRINKMKPFLILPDSYAEHVTKCELNLADFVNTRRPASLDENGIGVIHVYGPLLSDSTPIDRAMGATDYDEIAKEMYSLLNENAKAIVFEINSPGGSSTGLQDLAELIENCPVPTVAFCREACSAAYWLASGCSWIVARKSGYVGNIGAIMVLLDRSKLVENMGVKFLCFANDGAEYKSIGHIEGLSESQTAFLQESINTLGDNFKRHIERNRTVSAEVWKAGWYAFPQSADLGLIDEYGDMELAKSRALILTQSATV